MGSGTNFTKIRYLPKCSSCISCGFVHFNGERNVFSKEQNSHCLSYQSTDPFSLEGHLLSCLSEMQNLGEMSCGLMTLPILLLTEVDVNITILIVIKNGHGQNHGTWNHLLNYPGKLLVDIRRAGLGHG